MLPISCYLLEFNGMTKLKKMLGKLLSATKE